MIVYVRYPNARVDYVKAAMLGRLIRDKVIAEFYRPSEGRWISVEHGPVRSDNPALYVGVERRNGGRVSYKIEREELQAPVRR